MKKMVVNIKLEMEIKEDEWSTLLENIQDEKMSQWQARGAANELMTNDGRKEIFEYDHKIYDDEDSIIHEYEWMTNNEN